jgi:hypothetical protein
MLVTNPKQRANMADITNHPWMMKGFKAPPNNFLPYREPLQLPLDPEVVHRMHGFDFGSPDHITTMLTKGIASDQYQRAVRNSQRQLTSRIQETDHKRGVFYFCKRRNRFGGSTVVPLNEKLSLEEDPINAFGPLISIYYLAREKMARGRAESSPEVQSMPKTEKLLRYRIYQFRNWYMRIRNMMKW